MVSEITYQMENTLERDFTNLVCQVFPADCYCAECRRVKRPACILFSFPHPLFMAALHSLWDPSSPTRDQTHNPCSGSTKSQPLDLWGILCFLFWRCVFVSNKLLFTVVQLLNCIGFFEIPWTVVCQAPVSMGLPKQEYLSGLPFPSSGDLPDPGIEPVPPALQVDSLLLNHEGSPSFSYPYLKIYKNKGRILQEKALKTRL